MKRNFANIQAMRGVAALMVCLVHSVAMPVGVGMDYAVPFLGAIGPAGVDLFFVISGFIISTVASEAGGKAGGHGAVRLARDFALKRAARIYPIYWVVLLLAVVLSPHIFLAPAAVPARPLWRLILLIDTDNNKIMAAWTLVFELYFYLILTALLLLMPRHIFRGILAWSSVSIACILYFEATQDPLRFMVPFNPLLLEFMLGTLIAYLYRRRILLFPVGAIVTGVLLFAIGAYANNTFGTWQPWQRVIAFGPASALIIYGVVVVEAQHNWTIARVWQRLGDASYSLYIWHQTMFFMMLAISQRLGLFGMLPGYVIVPAWIIIVVAWSFLSFHHIEDPFRRWIEGRITGHRRAATLAPLGSRFAAPACLLVVAAGASGYVILSPNGPVSQSEAAQMTIVEQAPPPEAVQIEVAMNASQASLAQAAGSLGWQPDETLRSHLDTAMRPAPRMVHLHGWAADGSGRDRPLRVMAYQCGHYLGAVALQQSRPDVAAALRIAGDRFGFKRSFATPEGCDAGTVDILMVTQDQRFATLSQPLARATTSP